MALAESLALVGLGFTIRSGDTGNLAFATNAAPQMTFQSPTEAASALAQATKNTDETALTKVLGGEAKGLITSGDSESDKAAMQQFFSKYQQMNRWVDMSDGSRVLYIGADNFAFPVPLAKNASGSWYFDAVAGAQEIRAREIGRTNCSPSMRWPHLPTPSSSTQLTATRANMRNASSAHQANKTTCIGPVRIHWGAVRWHNSRNFRSHPSRRCRQTRPSSSMGTRCAFLLLRVMRHRAERRASWSTGR